MKHPMVLLSNILSSFILVLICETLRTLDSFDFTEANQITVHSGKRFLFTRVSVSFSFHSSSKIFDYLSLVFGNSS